ncbi:uncharacterized protein N7482_000031 [Penicillium canariense]|uniref:FAD-binding domain-containing protein n=1 Tax=Penicillium canariense TaxID=189055 RepID=A0A9W9LSJ4_9EURO|nr:uncharacterized protein N7482_000031 [Penicillium canariense]KAJ5174154.1 hypothetical protein N7482_000031 [Penicillium canariense]
MQLEKPIHQVASPEPELRTRKPPLPHKFVSVGPGGKCSFNEISGVNMANTIDIPVLIVGGGSCGLTLSTFLSDQGVDHVLCERHLSTSILPKAHIINQRTMEILRQHGMVDAIEKEATPPQQMCQVLWQTSLAGDGPLDRKVLGSLDTWGCQVGTERYATYRRDAPHMPSNLPLLFSEPIFRAAAEKRNPGKILFGHTVTDFKDEGDHVMVNVQSKEGDFKLYRAKYLIGADGGKSVGPKIGVQMVGPTGIRQISSIHFKADLSKYWDDRTCMTHFINPELGTGLRSGSILPIGPTWGRHSEQWMMNFVAKVDEPLFNDDAAASVVRNLLKLPQLDVEIMRLSTWVVERVHATKYREGRVFIGGDSAHRHPPTTGLGLNTAIGDSHNLAWKLAYVLKCKAEPTILDTYEPERQLIGKRNCDWAFFTFKCHAVIAAAMGLQDGKPEANKAHFANMFDGSSETGRAARAQLQYIINGQEIEFGAHEMDLGFFYPQGSIVSDGTSPPPEHPRHQVYTPTTRPGHRLPHAWIGRDGKICSTHDLVGSKGDFLLITDGAGQPWIEAAKKASAELGVGITTAQIVEPRQSASDDDYVDIESHWTSVKDFGAGGAILVRPDTMVAWRSFGPGAPELLSQGLASILGWKGVEKHR